MVGEVGVIDVFVFEEEHSDVVGCLGAAFVPGLVIECHSFSEVPPYAERSIVGSLEASVLQNRAEVYASFDTLHYAVRVRSCLRTALRACRLEPNPLSRA